MGDLAAPLNIDGIDCFVFLGEDGKQGGFICSVGDRGPEVTIHLHVAYSDAWALVRALHGAVGLNGQGAIVRKYPVPLPIAPGYQGIEWERFQCVGTGDWQPIKPRTDSNGMIFYDSVVIPFHFEITPWQTQEGLLTVGQNDPSGLPYTITVFKPAGEIICPPSGAYKYVTTGKPVLDINAGIYRPRTEISITRKYMPIIPITRIQSVLGCVNDGGVALSDYKFPKGTLLVVGADASDPYGDPSSGFLVWDVTYTILANSANNLKPADNEDLTVSWNQIMSPNGVYDEIRDSRNNLPFYPLNIRKYIWPEYVK